MREVWAQSSAASLWRHSRLSLELQTKFVVPPHLSQASEAQARDTEGQDESVGTARRPRGNPRS